MFMLFLAGLMCGMCGVVIVATFIVNREKKKLLSNTGVTSPQELLSKVKAELAKAKGNIDVSDRLGKVQAITSEQLMLLGQVDQPSSNSLHAKYKNSIGTRIKELEDEKAQILQSILDDGLDPTITTSDEHGQKESMLLSEYMVKSGYSAVARTAAAAVSVTESDPTGPRRVGNFLVYNGGKGDGQSN